MGILYRFCLPAAGLTFSLRTFAFRWMIHVSGQSFFQLHCAPQYTSHNSVLFLQSLPQFIPWRYHFLLFCVQTPALMLVGRNDVLKKRLHGRNGTDHLV